MNNNELKVQAYIDQRMATLKNNDEHAENLLNKIKANEAILADKLSHFQQLIKTTEDELFKTSHGDFYLTYHTIDHQENEMVELLRYLEVLWNVVKKFKDLLEK